MLIGINARNLGDFKIAFEATYAVNEHQFDEKLNAIEFQRSQGKDEKESKYIKSYLLEISSENC